MITLRTALPHPALREFVRLYAQREVHPSGPAVDVIIEPVPARLEQTLEFQFGVPFKVHFSENHHIWTPAQVMIGAHVSGAVRIEMQPGVISFAVFFRPTGLSRLFDIPLHHMANHNFDMALVSASARPLRDRLAECSTFERRVFTIESLLFSLAARASRKNTMLAVAEDIFSLRGVSRISQLARHTGLGLRQFERQFLQEIGISPKLFARVARFQTALDAKIASPQRPWLEIAHELHYHDQTHMIRDFHLLGGDTPGQLLSQIGDARPGALGAENEFQK